MSAACKGCGAPIEWIEVEGKRIPLDVRPLVYYKSDAGWTRLLGEAGVSHFATCPKANQFSASNRDAKPEAPTTGRKVAPPCNFTPAEMLDFIQRLDNAQFEVTDFESRFISGTLDRAAKYGDKLKFFGGQIGVIDEMVAKYGERLEGRQALAALKQPAPTGKVKINRNIPF